MAPPEGPPVCRMNALPSGTPPPISKTISRNVVPIGTSTRPILLRGRRARTFGALGMFRSDGGEPFGSLSDDNRDIGESLDIVDDGRETHITGFGGEGGLAGRLAAVSLGGVDQSGFLAADKSAGTEADLNIEIKAAAENILAQQAQHPSLVNCRLQAPDRHGIFGTDIDKAVMSADCVAGNRHRLNDRVRVILHDRAIHESTRVAFVGCISHTFSPWRRTATSPGQEVNRRDRVGGLENVDNLRRIVKETFGQRLITADSNRFRLSGSIRPFRSATRFCLR